MIHTKMETHTYRSASLKLDAALTAFARAPQTDAALHGVICTLVDEACCGRLLYTPCVRAQNGAVTPVHFEMHNTRVYAMYTDEAAARIVAEHCADEAGEGEAAVIGYPLRSVTARYPAALALNMGLPEQMILPPDAVHTVEHLCTVHELNAKEPAGSAWTPWVEIMNRYFAQQTAPAEPQGEAQAAEKTMYIPLGAAQRMPDASVKFTLG